MPIANRPEIPLYIFGFVTALVGSLLLTWVVRERARTVGLLDPTGERKLHTTPIPRVGGIAIFAAVTLALTAMILIFGDGPLHMNSGGKLPTVLAGAAAVHVLGLWDDKYNIRARWKFLAQIAIALAVFAAGVRVTTISLPLVGIVPLGTAVGMLFTVIWFVGITNAFNLIDGLDGLASGAAVFALTAMFFVASINGQVGGGIVTIVLVGATLGFLFYNFHPASIFLGDSGSLFLGFMLAGIGLLSSQKSSTVVAVAIPLVSLGLPVLDTSLAICRRFLRGQPIFSADRGHIHHRLLSLGHSPRNVALLLYAACATLALGGMLLVNNSSYVALVLVVVGLGIGVAVQRLRFQEFEELGRLVRRGVRPRETIGRNVRIRETGARLRGTTDMPSVFGCLERAFSDDDFVRAEVRLRRSFLEPADATLPDRRLEDDAPVWVWSAGRTVETRWWEIRLPLLGRQRERIGSLVLWHDGDATESSLSHVHTIARELRSQLERKLVELWHVPAAGDEEPSGEYERVVPIPATVEGFAPRVPAEPGRTREPRPEPRAGSTAA